MLLIPPVIIIMHLIQGDVLPLLLIGKQVLCRCAQYPLLCAKKNLNSVLWGFFLHFFCILDQQKDIVFCGMLRGTLGGGDNRGVGDTEKE